MGTTKLHRVTYVIIMAFSVAIFSVKVTPGMKLIDFGCGPTFCNVLAATRKFDYVVLADLTENNRREVEKLVRGSPDAADMTRNAQMQSLREGHVDPVRGKDEIIRRTQKAIKNVIPCNILDPRVLPEESWETFDVLLSSLCLESATCDASTYKTGVKNIGSLVKPAGRIVLSGVAGCTGYRCGEIFFPNVVLNAGLIRGALREAEFTIEQWIQDELNGRSVNFSFEYCYVVVAVKDVKPSHSSE